MYQNFKKMVIALSLIMAVTLGTTQKADAIVGICSWNPPLMGAGLAAASLGYAVAFAAGAGAEAGIRSDKTIYKILGVVSGAFSVVGIGVAIIGQIALPDKTVTMEYQKITPEIQKNLKLTDEEVQVFNEELDEVNTITSQVAIDLSQIENPTVQDSQEAWKKYSNVVSEKTFVVMGKLAMTMFTI